MSVATLKSVLNLAEPAEFTSRSIATLGPAGTSSEAAARHLTAYLRGEAEESTPPDDEITLYSSYELAGAAVSSGSSDLLIVANAYHGISQFYMDPALRIVTAFMFDTPHYGIAAAASSPTGGRVRIASHPAPIPLIEELLDMNKFDVAEIIRCDSTSAAAASVAEGKADLALTTEPASEIHRLKIISRSRPIRMLWSVFARSEGKARKTEGTTA